jgi:meiotically up-regulated gene 157 (Mug157) protein
MLLILQTFKEQQRKDSKGPYKFQRSNGNPLDTQFAGGYGNPTKKVGLIHSMFRPSDDATFYPFLISSNMFAVVSLRETAEIFSEIFKDENTSAQFKNLAKEVDEAIQKYAVLNHPKLGKFMPWKSMVSEMLCLWMMRMFRIYYPFRIWVTDPKKMKSIKIPENFL